MKKTLFFGLVFGFLLFGSFSGFCGSFNTVGQEDNALDGYAVFATEDVVILRSSTIHSGDVGVASPQTPDTLSTAQAGSAEGFDTLLSTQAPLPRNRVFVDRGVYFEYDTSIFGERVQIGREASVDNVYYSELENDGEIRGVEGDYAGNAPPVVLPEIPEYQPGTADITVNWGQERLLGPGSYGRVSVKPCGTLILEGGTYYMERLDLGYFEARVETRGPVDIVIEGQLNTWLKSYIGPEKGSDLRARDIRIYVCGTNGGNRFLRDFPKAAEIGRYGKIFANLYVPNGTIWIQGDCIAEGAFVGKNVLIGYGVSVTLDAAKSGRMPTHFNDPNLEAAVREALNKPEGDIYETDLENLLALNASGREILDLTGIEMCTALNNLVLSCNKISDITPLAGLQNLVSLNLNQNEVVDLSPLAGLTNLTRLYLGDNGITDESLRDVSGLTNLVTLVLDYNSISNLGPLAGLVNLTCLVLNDNAVMDLTPLKDLAQLNTLYLYNNQISDLLPLENLTSLTTLYLYDNQIYDLGPIAGLTNLTNLALDYNRIMNIGPLQNMKNLCTLYLNDNYITEIAPLSGLENLTTLILNTNEIHSIGALAKLHRISYLNLGYNRISDLTPLAELTGLSCLYLNDNTVSSVKPLVQNCDTGGLGAGDVVFINSNPLDEEGVTEDLTHLVDNGVMLYW